MKIKILVSSVILMLTLGLPLITECDNTSNLADTYAILPQELRELSPLNGAAVWLKQIIQNLYDDGPLTLDEPTDSTDPEFNQKLAAWLKQIPSPGIQKIIRVLFNRPPGTQGQADFRPSLTITDTPAELTKKIAYNLAQLFLYQMLEPELDGKNSEQRKQRLATALEFKKIGKVTSRDFYQAYYDEIYQGNQIISYALLALLWVIANNDRPLLKLYFTTLHASLQEGIKKLEKLTNPETAKKTPIPALGLPTPEEQTAALTQFATTLEKAKKIIENFDPEKFDINKEITSNDAANLKEKPIKEVIEDPKLTEVLVYSLLTPRTRPPVVILPSKDLSFKLDEQHEVYNLRACFEFAIQNLMNLLAFDPANEQFSVEQLEKNLGRKVHPDVTAFYTTHPEPKLANTVEVQTDWCKIVTNLDNIPYLKTTEPLSKSTIYAKLPDSYAIRLTDPTDEGTKQALQNLLLFVNEDPSSTHYELQGTLRAFILILNHLLQLDLFAGKNLGQELIKNAFVSTYLPKVLAPFGAEKNYSTIFSKSETSQDRGKLQILLPKFQTTVDFKFTRGHVDIIIQSIGEASEANLFFLKEDDFNALPILNILISPFQYLSLGTQNHEKSLIPYFSHYKIICKKNFLLSIFSKKTVSKNWLLLTRYMQDKYKLEYSETEEEQLIIRELENNMPNAQERAQTFLQKHADSTRYFLKKLWGYLVTTNPQEFAQKAFEAAKKQLENNDFEYKSSIFSFLTGPGLNTKNLISQKVINLFKDYIKYYPKNWANYFAYNIIIAIEKALIEKDIPFKDALPLLIFITKKTGDDIIADLLKNLETLIKKNAITYQDILTYMESTNASNANVLLLPKKIKLLETCIDKGMPAQEVAKYLTLQTLKDIVLDNTIAEQYQSTFDKIRTIANTILTDEPALRTDTKLWNMLEKTLPAEYFAPLREEFKNS